MDRRRPATRAHGSGTTTSSPAASRRTTIPEMIAGRRRAADQRCLAYVAVPRSGDDRHPRDVARCLGPRSKPGDAQRTSGSTATNSRGATTTTHCLQGPSGREGQASEPRAGNAGTRGLEAGETCFPFIDAGMRQLEQEGYFHNRPRQNVASYLTMHRPRRLARGGATLPERLVDHDPANSAASGRGRLDRDRLRGRANLRTPVERRASRQWGGPPPDVPELRGVPSTKIVDWPTLSDGEREELAPDYYAPNRRPERRLRARTARVRTALGKR